MPNESSLAEKASEPATDVVPTSTGRESLCIAISSLRAAFDLPLTVLYTELGTSLQQFGGVGLGGCGRDGKGVGGVVVGVRERERVEEGGRGWAHAIHIREQRGRVARLR